MRRLLVFLGAIAGLVILVALAGVAWMRGSLPTTEGTVAVPGLGAPVSIRRDDFGVPHIEAGSEADAYFALGYVHAQDRLWQMESARRAGAGRLSEVLGSVTEGTDRYLRTLGLYRAAEASLAAFDADARALLDAYAAGVNGYIASHGGALPPEFVVLGHRPEPWTAADSVVAVKMMSVQLSGNAGDEVLRQRLLGRLSPAQVDSLWARGADDAASNPAPDPAAGQARKDGSLSDGELAALMALLPPPRPIGLGSNNWVVSGEHAAGGQPLFANDPHLGLTAPTSWYLVHLKAPGLDVAGATLPAIPVVIIGRNAHVAWGVTNTGPDVQDLFIERLDPDEPDRYLTPGGPAPFETRAEIIAIKDAAPVHMVVRTTRHGPVVSDASLRFQTLTQSGHVVAMAWTAFSDDDTTLQAGFRLAHARDWPALARALTDYQAPQQNFVGADTAGMIGFFAPGRVPIRRNGTGWMPNRGWTGDGDWLGYIPYEALPRSESPPSGRIVTANQRIVPQDYPYFISHDWARPYRARRIEMLLASQDGHTAAGFAAMQSDQLSLMAQEMLPLLTGLETTGLARELRDRLRAWDGTMAADRPEPLIFYAWYRALTQRIYADELGDMFRAAWRLRPAFVAAVLRDDGIWCDDVTTERREGCDVQIGAALDSAIAWLQDTYGTDPDRWRWGDAHPAWHKHRVFSAIPLLGTLHDIRHSMGGGPYTVSQANIPFTDDQAPFTDIHGPGVRMVVDLADPDGTLAVISTGQSGNWFSPHYADQNPLWAAGSTVTLPMSEAAVAAATVRQLQLVPGR